MKQTINLYEFRRGFEELRPENFSYHGLEILFDFFEEMEESIGEEMEYDVIAICCDYCEMEFDDIAREYNIEIGEDDEKEDVIREYLEENTMLVGETDSTFIFANF